MATYKYTPHGVCSRQISFDIEDGKLHSVSFEGGCNGNLKAIGKLLEGQSAEDAVRILKGNDCSGRGTSCADQLAKAVEKALAENA
ncbi:TIGR03905 family TSCPD domain-containing protein [uncultured Ruminococcus sp.]|uniref:TIGR03905 family TSCPD domain-containing protein n=1 Tax=uncultured Ruminococcus sp. TaxID=165186 RepID=UPI0025F5105F|nr:TIGR03905 family TSCPD domain-containing protein [uncultured Ruminococcus sp.]